MSFLAVLLAVCARSASAHTLEVRVSEGKTVYSQSLDVAEGGQAHKDAVLSKEGTKQRKMLVNATLAPNAAAPGSFTLQYQLEISDSGGESGETFSSQASLALRPGSAVAAAECGAWKAHLILDGAAPPAAVSSADNHRVTVAIPDIGAKVKCMQLAGLDSQANVVAGGSERGSKHGFIMNTMLSANPKGGFVLQYQVEFTPKGKKGAQAQGEQALNPGLKARSKIGTFKLELLAENPGAYTGAPLPKASPDAAAAVAPAGMQCCCGDVPEAKKQDCQKTGGEDDCRMIGGKWASTCSGAAPAVALSSSVAAGSSSLMVVQEKVEPSAKPVPKPAAEEEEAPKKKLPPLRKSVKVGREAEEWEPYSVAFSTEARTVKTGFTRQVKRVRVKGPDAPPAAEGEAPKPTYSYTYRGKLSKKVKATARSYKEKGNEIVLVALFPKELRHKRTHVEIRYTVDAGFLEKVVIAAVTVAGGGAADDEKDSYALRKAGVQFEENSPASAKVVVGHLDPRPDRSSLNAGMVILAAFGDKELGVVTFAYSVRGVSGS